MCFDLPLLRMKNSVEVRLQERIIMIVCGAAKYMDI